MARATTESVSYKIEKCVAVLGETPSGWTKELNIVTWNGGEPKLDIRTWSPDHSKMTKGITLTEDEGKLILKALKEIYK